ncbi:HYC_CC_PP family protein [Ascidiimonas sp. W6]|uniref:HYC_CC_PP family protein n=1 Tax=Ascidiimonas meishanensis TaxID=3128903 RepID=UPI0030EEF388
MQKIFSKILAVLMAFVLLLSTISFSVGMHYCGDILVDVSLFKEAATCGMELREMTPEGSSITKMNCCKDIQIVVEGQENLKDTSSTNILTPVQTYMVIGFVYTSLTKFDEVKTKRHSFEEYSPPLLIRDIQLLDQIFLI